MKKESTELRHKYSAKALEAYAIIPHRTFYDMAKKLDLPDPNADVKAEIQAIYDEHEGRYGYRRIRDELENRENVHQYIKIVSFGCCRLLCNGCILDVYYFLYCYGPSILSRSRCVKFEPVGLPG